MEAKELNMRQRRLRNIARLLNILVLICSIIIFLVFSIETLEGPKVIPHSFYLKIQFSICIFFLIDFFYLFYISNNRWRYLAWNWLFFLISIPYLNIIDWLHLDISNSVSILLKAVILIRGGYGLVIMITWFTNSRMTNLLLSYLAILTGSAYFGSLAFYALEKNINSGIKGFGDSIWWACMDVTTVGCSIEPVTTEGRILAVVLAIMGMSVFPILTAYITSRVQSSMIKKEKADSQSGQPGQ